MGGSPSSAHGLSLRGKTELEMRRRSLNIVALIKYARTGEGGGELLDVLLARPPSHPSRTNASQLLSCHAFVPSRRVKGHFTVRRKCQISLSARKYLTSYSTLQSLSCMLGYLRERSRLSATTSKANTIRGSHSNRPRDRVVGWPSTNGETTSGLLGKESLCGK